MRAEPVPAAMLNHGRCQRFRCFCGKGCWYYGKDGAGFGRIHLTTDYPTLTAIKTRQLKDDLKISKLNDSMNSISLSF